MWGSAVACCRLLQVQTVCGPVQLQLCMHLQGCCALTLVAQCGLGLASYLPIQPAAAAVCEHGDHISTAWQYHHQTLHHIPCIDSSVHLMPWRPSLPSKLTVWLAQSTYSLAYGMTGSYVTAKSVCQTSVLSTSAAATAAAAASPVRDPLHKVD